MLVSLVLATALSQEPFTDVTASTGIDFVHINGAIGERWLPEIMGSGAALIDFDRDGDLDLYLVQGRSFDPSVPGPSDRLYRNDGDMRFTDVTDGSGLEDISDYGIGVAVGDYDSDGWDDLYVTALGSNRLLWNNHEGGFVDRTDAAGVQDDRLSVPSTFFDMDGDGDLDLYVGSYTQWSLELHKPCRSGASAIDYCSPKVFRPENDRLFRNEGDGHFVNITAESRFSSSFGPALGVIATDLDGDGRLDLYIANDGAPNQLWINQGDGVFQDNAMFAGTALNMDGHAEASMGVDAGDADSDGDLDLFMTHLTGETNTLYINQGGEFFDDSSVTSGLGSPSTAMTGFGTRFIDYDNDGALDVLVTNGAVMLIPEQLAAGEVAPLRMRKQLLRNDGTGHFTDITASAGAAFEDLRVGRGLAIGDLDDDGDLDAIVTGNGGPVQVLQNELGSRASWLGFDLRDARGASIAGAQIRISCGDLQMLRSAQRDGSYASAGDPRALFGLGDHTGNCDAAIHWPDGRVTQHDSLELRRYHRIEARP